MTDLLRRGRLEVETDLLLGVEEVLLLEHAAVAVRESGAVQAPSAPTVPVDAKPAPRGFDAALFATGGAGSRVPRSVPADATNLTVSGTVPCKDSVMAWAAQGPYRVFEDGTVEFLAAPVPPCQGGDYYVWIGFPK